MDGKQLRAHEVRSPKPYSHSLNLDNRGKTDRSSLINPHPRPFSHKWEKGECKGHWPLNPQKLELINHQTTLENLIDSFAAPLKADANASRPVYLEITLKYAV